jgi:hypothetical protein
VRHGQAALSGSKTKAPGFAGGYLPRRIERVCKQAAPAESVMRAHRFSTH